MTEEVLKLIKEKNLQKKKNYRVYSITQNKITKKCREAKDIWMKEINERFKRT